MVLGGMRPPGGILLEGLSLLLHMIARSIETPSKLDHGLPLFLGRFVCTGRCFHYCESSGDGGSYTKGLTEGFAGTDEQSL